MLIFIYNLLYKSQKLIFGVLLRFVGYYMVNWLMDCVDFKVKILIT